jgi:hypothetical protein
MRRIAMAVVLFLGAIAPLAAGSSPAWAVTSCGNFSYDMGPAYDWTRTQNWDVRGVRAPLQVRVDGGLCDMPGGGKDPFNYAWIAIQCDPSYCSDISQIGYRHDFGNAGAHWCRSYGVGTGSLVDYDCDQDPNDGNLYFKVVRYWDPISSHYYYDIADCGLDSGGYGGCRTENSQDIAYTHPESDIVSEANYGNQNQGANCVIHIMGSTGDHQNLGTSSYPVQGSTDDGSNWSTRTWNFFWDNGDSSCSSPYETSTSSNGMSYWDTRNSS